MEYAIEASNAGTKKFLYSLMPSILEQLKLTNSRRAVLVKVTNGISAGNEGATTYVEIADCYLVLLKPPEAFTAKSMVELGITLAHEMVHVKQLAKGHMKIVGNGTVVWMGKRYGKKTKYLDQPWEQHAFARQEIIARRALEV